MERKTSSSLFVFWELFLDLLPQAFGSVLSKRLLWLSSISDLSKESQVEGGLC